MIDKLKSTAYGSVALIAFFALWQFVSVREIVNSAVIPAPLTVGRALIDSLQSGLLLQQTGISLTNVGIGFILAILICTPAGIIIGTFYQKFERPLLPFMRMCEKINPFALFPVFMILFGIGALEKVMVVLWVSQWPLLFNTIDGVRNLDRTMIKSARSMGATRRDLLFKVIVPMTMPYIFTGVRYSAQLAFFMIIASEMVGASEGLGWQFLSANQAYNVPLMFGIIVYITVLAIIINVLFTKLENRFSGWKQSTFEL